MAQMLAAVDDVQIELWIGLFQAWRVEGAGAVQPKIIRAVPSVGEAAADRSLASLAGALRPAAARDEGFEVLTDAARVAREPSGVISS
jgi:hypothetical protein